MKNTYMELAEDAAQMERNGLLSQAIALWKRAIAQANKPSNKEWAARRMAFCIAWHRQ